MSDSNLISYLIGWGELVIKWNKRKQSGEKIDFPETDFKWKELEKLAQKFYQDYEEFDFKTLLAKLDKIVCEIVSLIENTENSKLYKEPWYNKWTMGRMIQLNTSSPYKNARNRIRKWKKIKRL